MVTPYVIPADFRAFVLWRQAQPQLDPSIRLAAYVSLIVPLLAVLIGDVEGGIAREEPARHQSKERASLENPRAAPRACSPWCTKPPRLVSSGWLCPSRTRASRRLSYPDWERVRQRTARLPDTPLPKA